MIIISPAHGFPWAECDHTESIGDPMPRVRLYLLMCIWKKQNKSKQLADDGETNFNHVSCTVLNVPFVISLLKIDSN